VEAEVARRVEKEVSQRVQAKVQEYLQSDAFREMIEKYKKEEFDKMKARVVQDAERERQRILDEERRRELVSHPSTTTRGSCLSRVVSSLATSTSTHAYIRTSPTSYPP